MTFVKIHIRPDVQKVWQSDMHYSEDGRMRDHDLGRHEKIKKGSVVSLSTIDVQKTIDGLETTYRDVFRTSEELKWKLDALSMPRIEMPSSIPTRIGYDGEGGLVHKRIPQIHEEKVLFYQVSISRGVVVVDCHSTSPDVVVEVDDRFPKYFSRKKFVSFKKYEYTGEFDEIVRELFSQHQGIPYVPFSSKEEETTVVEPVQSGFALGDLSMFAPKKQRR